MTRCYNKIRGGFGLGWKGGKMTECVICGVCIKCLFLVIGKYNKI